jgi:YVTN family beta-propeller protein
VLTTIPTGSFNVPFGIAVTPDGKRLYVANIGSNSISVVDTMTASVVATVAVGVNPVAVAINPDGTLAYVANRGSNTVSVIDTKTSPPAEVFIIPAGLNPNGIAVTADGKHAYATNNGVNTVSLIDVSVPTFVVGNAPVAVGPQSICALFLSFSPTLSVVLGHTANTDSFTFQAGFTLSSTAPAINPVTQPVTIHVGNYTGTIPPGSFKHGDAAYTFAGVINGVSLNVTITPAGTLR